MSGWHGGQWGLGLVCRIEAAWRVSGVLACHVGSARWVGGGGAGWRWFVFSRPKVLCHVGAARWVGDGGVSGQDRGGSRARMACNVQGFACRVGAVQWVGGGGMLGRGWQWPATLKPWGWSMWNNVMVAIAAPLCMRAASIHPHPNTPPLPTRCTAPTWHAKPSTQCHSCTRATSILPQHPAITNPPHRPNTAYKTFG
ncbi:hypothetical protein EDB86DRAFT_2829571 [Lactarius hatsudake]|nr:hypothetical protein EDB86DRAFT_2829571 [Lactarius hatsudake]